MDFNVNKSANQENLAENENQRQEEKERKWRDPNEDVKYVCEGGKVQCKHCSSPVATLKVTAENVMLQDKPWATVGDNIWTGELWFYRYLHASKMGKPQAALQVGYQSGTVGEPLGNHHWQPSCAFGQVHH